MSGFRADEHAAVAARRKRVLKWAGVAVIWIASLSVATFALVWNAMFAQMPQLPSKDALWGLNREPAIEFLDQSGKTIAVRGPRYGRVVSPAELPKHVVEAFLAVEDRRFYEHGGVDRLAILRAAFSNWRAGDTVQGGSTLTQQLVKNLFLTPEKTLRRKAQEARLAYDLEKELTKDEILELYINRTFLGARSYGLDAAARRYFGKSAMDLSVSEAALIAGLPKAPSRFSPTTNPDAALERRNFVIDRMVSSGFISKKQGKLSKAEPIQLAQEEAPDNMGYVLDYATEEARRKIARSAPDLLVTLTIDENLQAHAHDTLNRIIEETGEDKRVSQGSIVILQPSGAIRAMIGGRSYAESQFNRATQAQRQPGSAFKAFVYAAALEAGLQQYTVRNDEPIRIKGWEPRNYGGRYIGPVTLSQAFAQSLNTVAAELGEEIGMERVIELARRFGVRSPLSKFPSVALGSDEANLMELTQAYATFAARGQKVQPYLVSEVRNSRGDVLFRRDDRKPQQIYADALNRQMVAMMSRVVKRGTGRAAQLDVGPQIEYQADGVTPVVMSAVPRARILRDTAGKTGTSQDWRDAWFIGFTSDFIGGVWVGNDDDSPMRRVTGGDLPARIWREVMTVAHEGLPNTPLPGAEEVSAITTYAERRLAYYRSVADAFAIIEARAAGPGEGTARPGEALP